MTNFYHLLQVERTASPAEIRQSYLKLAKQTHPDKIVQDKDSFTEIHAAYQTLYHSDSRERYDAFLTSKNSDIYPLAIENCMIHDEISKHLLTMNEMQVMHPCRCGGQFVGPMECLAELPSVLPCDTCTLFILVRD